MGGTQDKRQEPGKGREEQQRPQRPGQDPVHPQPGQPSRGKGPEETKRRREDNPLHEERDLRDEEL
ncbi:hypothetical protein J7E99_38475 [Streptomyces sp. ISL-44]|uniref:hypothetical protein n=1 Tax=Streptomyces sp. ISL-44 TaxID=2819184 RepID=UPI001BE7CDD1|nr:hypothetical protein [Streptomyces sp. ISL-44]MBT2545793.1 hypothetical protein [Streptomyces sp. ISL-44]MBT2546395.1 hypothetical protein [Streptomyces sp. ISL-44]